MKNNFNTMRNILMLCAVMLLSGCTQYKVYSVKDNPTLPVNGGVVYALPRTQLCVAVTVQRRDLSSAPYSAYATDYLGVASSGTDTSYNIVDIDVSSVNIADPDHCYFIKVNRGSVTVDERHLLLAVGMPNPQENTVSAAIPSRNGTPASARNNLRASYNLYDRADTFYTRYDAPNRPTMVSTRKDVRSIKQQAAAAAERLDEIQSKRQELISGEYEGSYSPEAIQYILTQLQRQEEEIIASFCGEAKTETIRFYVEPQMRKREDYCDTIIWFSPSEGFMGDADNLSKDAFPIICTVHNDNDTKTIDRFVKYHTSGFTQNSSSGRTGTAASRSRDRKGFRYRIPAGATVTVTTPQFSVSRQVKMSQLGPVISLPRNRIKALFDANTLDLRQFERSR